VPDKEIANPLAGSDVNAAKTVQQYVDEYRQRSDPE